MRTEVTQANLSTHRFGTSRPRGLGSHVGLPMSSLLVVLYGHNLLGPAVQADTRGDCPRGLTEKEFPRPELAIRPGWDLPE